MAESFTPLERDLQATNEKHFCETINTIAAHAEDVIMSAGERYGDPYTDILLVLRESSHTPKSLLDMKINLGLDSSIAAIVTTEGNAVLIKTPVSDGILERIFNNQPISDNVAYAFKEVREASKTRAAQVNLDSVQQLETSIRASLGHAWNPPGRPEQPQETDHPDQPAA
jgi:hypothetical protein